MRSPTSALAWSIWRQYRSYLVAMLGAIFTFALFHPALCRTIGLNLDASNALDAFAATFSERIKHSTPLFGIIQVLLMIFLLLSPLGFMVTSMLYLVRIFTFAEGDTDRGFSFPARIFRLPISSGFLAGWLMLAGAAAVTLVFLGWTRLVHQPPIDVFDGYPNLLVWLTALVLVQSCVWSLDAFPITRILLLSGMLCFLGYLAGPSAPPMLVQNRTVILLLLMGLGAVTAPIGLSKIRHGNWQRIRWPGLRQRHATEAKRVKARDQSPFHSVSGAQLWLEWRRHGRKLCLYVAALSGAAVLTMTIVSLVKGGLSDGDTSGLVCFLLAVSPFIHFAHGVAPEHTLPAFIATRPLADGEIATAKLKSAALSALVSCLISVAALAVVPLVGDIHSAFAHPDFLFQNATLLLRLSPVLFLAAVVLTWRFVAVNLCFGAAGESWLARAPVFLTYGAMGLVAFVCYRVQQPEKQAALLQILPPVLGALLILKLILAAWSFNTCLKRRLLPFASVVKYLLIWCLLAVSFTTPIIVVFHHQPWLAMLVLALLLAVPLARIGLLPICFAVQRHR